MLAKGYALAKTRRTSSEGLGEIIATLEDGTTVDYAAFNDSRELHQGLHGGRRKGPAGPARPGAAAHLFLRSLSRRPNRPRHQLHAQA